MRFAKQTRHDLAETARMLHLVLLQDERERFLTQSDRAALTDARAILNAKLFGDAGRELARVG